MRKLFLIIFMCVMTAQTFAQCNEKTKAQVDSMKESLTYPKYNIGDILWICFYASDDFSDDKKATYSDLVFYKVRIVDIKPTNGLDMVDFNDSFLISNSGKKVEWKYQYVDTSIPKPTVGDFSQSYYDEDRLYKTKEECFYNINKGKE